MDPTNTSSTEGVGIPQEVKKSDVVKDTKSESITSAQEVLQKQDLRSSDKKIKGALLTDEAKNTNEEARTNKLERQFFVTGDSTSVDAKPHDLKLYSLDKHDAESILLQKGKIGSFLIRPSSLKDHVVICSVYTTPSLANTSNKYIDQVLLVPNGKGSYTFQASYLKDRGLNDTEIAKINIPRSLSQMVEFYKNGGWRGPAQENQKCEFFDYSTIEREKEINAKVVAKFNDSKGEVIPENKLICSMPSQKATELLNEMPNGSFIILNDYTGVKVAQKVAGEVKFDRLQPVDEEENYQLTVDENSMRDKGFVTNQIKAINDSKPRPLSDIVEFYKKGGWQLDSGTYIDPSKMFQERLKAGLPKLSKISGSEGQSKPYEMDAPKAEAFLKGKPVKAFICRTSKEAGKFTLTQIIPGAVIHTRLSIDDKGNYYPTGSNVKQLKEQGYSDEEIKTMGKPLADIIEFFKQGGLDFDKAETYSAADIEEFREHEKVRKQAIDRLNASESEYGASEKRYDDSQNVFSTPEVIFSPDADRDKNRLKRQDLFDEFQKVGGGFVIINHPPVGGGLPPLTHLYMLKYEKDKNYPYPHLDIYMRQVPTNPGNTPLYQLELDDKMRNYLDKLGYSQQEIATIELPHPLSRIKAFVEGGGMDLKPGQNKFIRRA